MYCIVTIYCYEDGTLWYGYLHSCTMMFESKKAVIETFYLISKILVCLFLTLQYFSNPAMLIVVYLKVLLSKAITNIVTITNPLLMKHLMSL